MILPAQCREDYLPKMLNFSEMAPGTEQVKIIEGVALFYVNILMDRFDLPYTIQKHLTVKQEVEKFGNPLFLLSFHFEMDFMQQKMFVSEKSSKDVSEAIVNALKYIL